MAKGYMIKTFEGELLPWTGGWDSEFIAWSMFLSGRREEIDDYVIRKYEQRGYKAVAVDITEVGEG